MIDDGTNNNESNTSVTGQGRQNSTWSRTQWESLESDPDFSDDLGYQITNWEQFETLDGTDQVMFLPEDKAELKDAAFLVADDSDLLNLANHC